MIFPVSFAFKRDSAFERCTKSKDRTCRAPQFALSFQYHLNVGINDFFEMRAAA